MRRRSARRRSGRRGARRRPRLARAWPGAARRRRWRRAALRALRRARWPLRLALGAAVLVLAWAAANGIYQVVRKPTELFFPVSGTLHKTPAETWRSYGPIFRRHATDVMRPELLAALAQVESSGNPVARTYWRWSWAFDPFEIYRPASSAVGMYQITDGTFAQARRYCIRNHAVAEQGPWYDWRACWWNALYFRVVPSHAVELTSAYLDRTVSRTLARHGIRNATLEQKQALAALTHLCGPGAGDRHARGGLRPTRMRCADHDARAYVARVQAMARVFAALAARE